MADYEIFREQLAIKYPSYGHALWGPRPKNPDRPVQVGDVGFIRRGNFHRLFNALLPADDPSHELGVPEYHEPLVPNLLDHLHIDSLDRNNYCSAGVSVEPDPGYHSGPGDFPQVSFQCKGTRGGAVLSLPVTARREDTLAQGDFGRWMAKNIGSWFAFARNLGLGIERMEEIVLVTGCDRARSWTNVSFLINDFDAQVSFGVKAEASINFQFSPENARGAVLRHGPEGANLPENQCVFIRGFRVARTFWISPKHLKAAAGPSSDPGDYDRDPDTEVISFSANSKYRDPLHVLLDYIAGQASDCDLVLAHDNDLMAVNGIGHDTLLETLEPELMMDLLQKSNIEIHQVLGDLSPDNSLSGPNTNMGNVKLAMLPMTFQNWNSNIARLEQQSRLNVKPLPGLGIKRQLSRESLGDLDNVEPGLLWIHTVSKEIVDSVSDQEKTRQEVINEVIYIERDFVRDMEYLRDVWIAPLSTQDILPEARRADFIEQVFWNIHDIIEVNTRLRDALNKRQKSYAVIEGVADIFLDIVPHFAPFVSYGLHRLYGKYEFEKEKSSNPAFAQFVEETERRPDSRKLELNVYLTKPMVHLTHYPLRLEALLKHTPDESSDKQDIPKVVTLIREFLAEVNRETGRTENRFNLLQLDQQLLFRPGEQVDLRLKEEGREMIYKGPLNRRGGPLGDSGELSVFLLDHVLLLAKQKNKAEEYKVYRRPIPLELLLIISTDESGTRPVVTARSQRKSSGANGGNPPQPYPPVIPVKLEGDGGKTGFAITFVHLGRKFYQMTLWAASHANHRKWVESVTRQQDLMRDRSQFFEMDKLSEGVFQAANRANCAAPFSGGQKVAYGTFDGVYFQDLREPNREPIKVLALTDVTQVDVLDEYGLLIVRSEGQVITFPLDALEAMDPLLALKRAKRIATHASFYKSGVCVGRTFVCVVKTSPRSSTIQIFEPIDQNVRGNPTFRKLLQGGGDSDTLRVYKEFFIPVQSSSIHFLRTKLCVVCVNGFEIIDPDTLDTQGLLDPSDESLGFVRRRRGDHTWPKPVAIYRIENEFLLCYDEVAFCISRGGRRSRKDFLVYWEGSPTSFAFQYPYVLAFEPTFVEIRNVETGSMAQVIQGNNLRCLYTASNIISSQQAQEDIILASDDRVLTLRMAALPGK